ncbi:MAG TPA: hypothetical protein VG452_02020 [Egibacteraceae bacterium]|nr:hypothetical protein [Actinomycetota bacterium]HWB70967.1 hypothetical protein [Egibacteraceae bacterium]
MQQDLGIGLGAVALVVGFPLLLMCLLWLLGRLEAWMLEPDERAAAVTRLLEQVDEAEEVERAVTRLMARVADRPAGERPSQRPGSRRAG